MDTAEPFALAADDPAEIAFRRGCGILTPMEAERARGLFEEAVRGAGPRMLWRVAEVCLETNESAYWMRRAVVSESEPGGITVDPGVLPILGSLEDRLVQDWEIAVRSDDRARAVAALGAAEHRVTLVLEDGRELLREEAEDVLCETELYNPNYVAVREDVPCLVMDCKGGMYPYLARTALRIVADELRGAGVRRAHLYTRSTFTSADGAAP
ncbi:hypothetical protein [Streptomyces sp. CAU 1734]|uniref:hypothetical protein n=1 Tax=Streptomyces sp. CAU 1734 TaxID=3140360 RepID=UPI003260EECD